MNRKTVILLAAIAALSSSQLLAQDYQLNHLDSRGFSGMAKQARVESLPSDFFGTNQQAQVPVASNDVDTTGTNMLVLGAFATLLTAGSVITGLCLMRRRTNQRHRVAPVKMFA